ncbi:4'-phosphopantetheinyl transferase superfamily protein [Bordetella sp. N]|uniref:4'-phosphopantetheinyl transferase family protein n=1 Tax=Bordetella sp. N TaxID=1746199 RepID=UPI00070C77CC|nr:4'-phosphopantetheinyl transferase superfamily protein [Bordetella sp. N]ALM82667.1 hypothetical protein ASB57_06605 [Bordetella sp. N]
MASPLLPLDEWGRALGIHVAEVRPAGAPADIRLLRVTLPIVVAGSGAAGSGVAGSGAAGSGAPGAPAPDLDAAGIADPATTWQAAQAGLIAAEQARMRRYHHVADQLRFGATRALLRQVLAWHLHADALQNVVITATPTGRPQCEGSGLDFNVSHSGSSSCIAFSTQRRVGVDVEASGRQALPLNVQAMALTDTELNDAATLDETARNAAFYTTWTRKEAVLKACGLGITEALRAFHLRTSASGWVPVVEEGADPAMTHVLQDLYGVDCWDDEAGRAALAWSAF